MDNFHELKLRYHWKKRLKFAKNNEKILLENYKYLKKSS